MQVMKNLADIDEVGRGIAGAFVATVYGVAIANLIFLPAGAKLKARLRSEIQLRELMLEGVLGIVEGLNPKLIRTRLDAYLSHSGGKKKGAAGAKGAPAAAAAVEG
jgi:chemotaxis protein MotA